MRFQTLSSWIVFFALVVPSVSSAEKSRDPADLTAYLAQIRDWSMSEYARMDIRMIAAIMSESALLTFRKDEETGAYWPSYTSAFCPSPDMDPAELKRIQNEEEAKIISILAILQPLADADNSGFVSTEEGSRFRDLVEFAYRASHVATHEGRDIERICAGLSMKEDRFQELASQYKELLAEARTRGVDLPGLDL